MCIYLYRHDNYSIIVFNYNARPVFVLPLECEDVVTCPDTS